MSTQGTTTLDFGAFPGGSDASTTVTGQTGILSNSLVEAWLFPATTADHSSDEHLVVPMKIIAHTIVPGTGFTITGISLDYGTEPLAPQQTTSVVNESQKLLAGGKSTGLIWGVWNVAWVWN